jgi:hypothetical protein
MLDHLTAPHRPPGAAPGRLAVDPAEQLLTAGGDSRLLVDPATGLNAYGCSPTPRPWAITFASTTATSISDYAFAAVERCRARVLEAADTGAAWRQEIGAIRRALLEHYRVEGDGVEIVLTPSGTDGELCALAVHRQGHAGPTTNLVIAPEETGTGVALAAAGKHFAAVTARGVAVEKGARIAGLADDVELAAVALREPTGTARLRVIVDAEVEHAVCQAIEAGRRVLLHVLDVSKTGLLAPSAACIARLRDQHGDALDVLVDACQARLSAASVRGYLAAGCMVLVTGSKFFTGPPFAGALLLPPSFGARLRRGGALPEGLSAYCSRVEWPAAAAVADGLPDDVNHGLVVRWVAALAEMAAFDEVVPLLARRVLETFGARVRAAIDASRDLILHPVPPPARQDPLAWDALTTIFAFSVRGPDGKPLDVEALRTIHRALNRDLSAALPADDETITETDRTLASKCCHIGQPVVLAGAASSPTGREIGVLRIAAGARLVSGVSGDPALGPDVESRLAREIADAILALDKISLILRHRERLTAGIV